MYPRFRPPKLRTPLKVTPEITALAAELGGEETPFFVQIEPHPSAECGKCHFNVMKAVDEQGGSIVFGWVIWLCNRGWLEAEFHSLWRSPDGKLLDITPDPDGETRRLFVIDRHRRWEGHAIPSRRKPLWGGIQTLQICDALNRADEIRSRYAFGEPLSEADAQSYMALQVLAALRLAGVSQANAETHSAPRRGDRNKKRSRKQRKNCKRRKRRRCR